MKVAIYGRRSKGQEPEGQLGRLRAAALAEGHSIVLEASDVATGSDPNRPGWVKVMNAVRGGHVQGVWITKTDRAMRSAKHYLEAVESFLARGCHLRVLDQPMACVADRDDPMSRAFRTIGAAFAQLELDLADERSNEGHYVKDGRTYGPSGKPVGRPPGYGEGHQFRLRNGRREHDKARCRACRGGETGGLVATVADRANSTPLGEPTGFPSTSAIRESKGTSLGSESIEAPRIGLKENGGA